MTQQAGGLVIGGRILALALSYWRASLPAGLRSPAEKGADESEEGVGEIASVLGTSWFHPGGRDAALYVRQRGLTLQFFEAAALQCSTLQLSVEPKLNGRLREPRRYA